MPTANNDQSGGPGSGSSSPPSGEPTDGDTSNGRSSGGRPSTGSSGNVTEGRSNSNSSNTNGQNSDPVIACSTRYAGGKTKQTLRPQTPNSPVTRFIRVDQVVARDFEEGKPLGRVKGLVSTVRPSLPRQSLTTYHSKSFRNVPRSSALSA